MKETLKFYIVLLLFFISGIVGLIYEIVWARQLQHLFGSTTFSVSAILTSFFAGMALGSYLLGRWGNRGNPVRIYAVLELVIGIYAMFSPIFLGIIDKIYLILAPKFSNHFMLAQMVKFLLSFVIFIIPCTLMGGTLPVLSRFAKGQSESIGGAVGKLYAANTLGAVVGAGITGFFLIERFGLSSTVLIGGCTNLVIAVVSFLMTATAGTLHIFSEHETIDIKRINLRAFLIPVLAYGLSGFCALGYEVLWTRGLIQTVTSSTYAFSIVLIIFLLGTALGSAVVSFMSTRIKMPVVWFATIQILLGFSILISIFILIRVPDYYNIMFQRLADLKWASGIISAGIVSALLVFVPTFLMGGLFPIVVSWARIFNTEIGYGVGSIYCGNTVGAILGSFCSGFVMIPLFGLLNSLFVLASINLFLGVFFLWQQFWSRNFRIPLFGTVAVIITWFVCLFILPKTIFELQIPQDFKLLFYKEGAVANVAVYQCTAPGRDFKILKTNGVYLSGGTDKHALMIQRRQGHLPMLLHNQPDSVLLVGLATGITLSAVAEHNAKRIECVEIVPSQLRTLKFFEKENKNVVTDQRVRIIIDDGRSYIRATKKSYDVIIADLFQVRSAGTGDLYSFEHVTACRNRLKPDGIMVQWFPLQQMSEENFKSAIKSFASVFPFVQLWFCDTDPQKPVMALVASFKQIILDVDEFDRRIHKSTAESLASIGYDNPYFFISQCIMQTETVKKYIGNAKINTYDKPVIEFSALRTMKQEASREIINSLLKIKSPLRFEAKTDQAQEKMEFYFRAHYQNLIAQVFSLKNEWRKSEILLHDVLKRTPENFDTRRLLGRSKVILAEKLIRRGQPESALQKLDSAQVLGEDDIFMYDLMKAARKMKEEGKL